MKLLQRFPSLVSRVIDGETGNKVAQLWEVRYIKMKQIITISKDFFTIYQLIGLEKPGLQEIDIIQSKVYTLLSPHGCNFLVTTM